ncbi:MAG: hypothetical protein IRY90_21735, partial [Actinomadura rubrobrunea]|nr:hypothetical protein [Actinomadura rubrobrunea]
PEGSKYDNLAELPTGSRIATSAVRRKAQLLRARPDLHVDRRHMTRGTQGWVISHISSRGSLFTPCCVR